MKAVRGITATTQSSDAVTAAERGRSSIDDNFPK
jgi:hypothetical protein